jgi:hypothetical protein
MKFQGEQRLEITVMRWRTQSAKEVLYCDVGMFVDSFE